jgi:hypothetical protein
MMIINQQIQLCMQLLGADAPPPGINGPLGAGASALVVFQLISCLSFLFKTT